SRAGRDNARPSGAPGGRRSRTAQQRSSVPLPAFLHTFFPITTSGRAWNDGLGSSTSPQQDFLEFQQKIAAMKHDAVGDHLQGELGTFLTFVKGFVGIGILSLPYVKASLP
ncbi:unnamed protein product, partial [Amoebophrya sp. A25]